MSRVRVVSIVATLLALGACVSAPVGPDPVVLLDRARAMQLAGLELEAMDAYRSSFRADPRLLDAHVGYQDLVLARGEGRLLPSEYDALRTGSLRLDRYLRVRFRPSAASRPVLEVLAAGRDDVAAASAVDLARIHVREGRDAEALTSAEAALALRPEDPRALLVRGAALESLGRGVEAEAAYREAAEAGAAPVVARTARARVLLDLRRPEEAARALAAVPGAHRKTVEFHLVEADVCLVRGRDDEADSALEAALAMAPEDRRPRRRLGLRLAEREPRRARALLAPLAGADSRDTEVLVVMGRLDLAAGRPVLAARKLERALALEGDESLLVDLLRARLEAGETAAVADAAVGVSPDALVLRARARRAEGREAEAKADLEAALVREPRHEGAAAELALVLVALGRAEEALAVLGDRPTTAPIATARGQVHLARGDVKAAETALREAVSLDAGDASVYLSLAELMRRLRRPDDRLRWLRAGLAARPEDPGLTLALVDALGTAPEAESLIREMLRRSPNRPGASARLVRILLGRGAVEEALRRAFRALEAGPRDVAARAALADAYAAAGRPDEAERAYAHALELDPDDLGALLGRGRLLSRLGPERADEATASYREAIRVDPWSSRARIGLARLCLGAGDQTGALEVLEPMRSGPRPHPEALDMSARALESLDRFEEAVEALRRLLRLRPLDPNVHVRLGRLQWAGGKRHRALFLLRRSLQLGADPAVVEPIIREILAGD